ncbi:hypothetical protein FGO68_gene16137 [Halteria grandinella]|uniref:Uncharacterized protein n=1 Tax=Halteria grandinella TaxID=5974 RepID=A0A8J8NVZ7_HALGN|nr:hypothetical protein FGO68_gene16137 [Halteria grandinella]
MVISGMPIQKLLQLLKTQKNQKPLTTEQQAYSIKVRHQRDQYSMEKVLIKFYISLSQQQQVLQNNAIVLMKLKHSLSRTPLSMKQILTHTDLQLLSYLTNLNIQNSTFPSILINYSHLNSAMVTCTPSIRKSRSQVQSQIMFCMKFCSKGQLIKKCSFNRILISKIYTIKISLKMLPLN